MKVKKILLLFFIGEIVSFFLTISGFWIGIAFITSLFVLFTHKIEFMFFYDDDF